MYQVENQKERQKLFSQCMEKAPLIMYCMLTKFSHAATPILPLHGLLYHLWSNSDNVNIKQLSDDINMSLSDPSLVLKLHESSEASAQPVTTSEKSHNL